MGSFLTVTSFAISPAKIHVPRTGWSECAIVWLTISMLTGSRKSTLHGYIVSLVRRAKEEIGCKGQFLAFYHNLKFMHNLQKFAATST